MGRTKSRTKKKDGGGGFNRRKRDRLTTTNPGADSGVVNPFDAVARKGAWSNSATNKHHAKRATNQESRQRIVVEELRRMRRNNKFSDRRVAQNDSRLSGEEKAGMRFALQQKRRFESGNRTFNLSEADEDIIKTDESSEEDEGEDEWDDASGSRIVEGTRRSRPAEQKNKRKEALSNMIAQSKKEKAVRHMVREQQMDTTDKLDDVFSKLSGVGALRYSARTSSTRPVSASGEYDSLYTALKFDKTVLPARDQAPRIEGGKVAVDSALTSPARRTTHDGNDFLSLFEKYKEQSGRIDSQKGIDNMEKLAANIHRAMQSDIPSAVRVLLKALEEYRSQVCGGEMSATQFLAIHAFFELIGGLFSAANELLHPVTTPALAMTVELVTSYRIRCLKDCARVLLLCAPILRMAKESGRYLPEIAAFLKGALMLCVNSEPESNQFPTMSFPVSKPHCHMLLLEDDERSKLDEKPAKDHSPLLRFSLHTEDAVGEDDEGELKIFTVGALISTVQRYLELYTLQSPAFAHSLYAPFRDLLAKLPLTYYPSSLARAVDQLQSHIERKICGAKLTQMKLQQHGGGAVKSKPLLDPRFDECFDPLRLVGRGQSSSNEKRLQRVRRNLRKETRGAMRKLRADSTLLAQEQASHDSRVRQERNKKTKRILSSLQEQESDYKKRQIMTKRRKF